MSSPEPQTDISTIVNARILHMYSFGVNIDEIKKYLGTIPPTTNPILLDKNSIMILSKSQSDKPSYYFPNKTQINKDSLNIIKESGIPIYFPLNEDYSITINYDKISMFGYRAENTKITFTSETKKFQIISERTTKNAGITREYINIYNDKEFNDLIEYFGEKIFTASICIKFYTFEEQLARMKKYLKKLDSYIKKTKTKDNDNKLLPRLIKLEKYYKKTYRKMFDKFISRESKVYLQFAFFYNKSITDKKIVKIKI